MRIAARLRSWLRALTGRNRLEANLDDELAFHVEQRAEDLMRGGLSRDEARRKARAELGPIAAQKEECREALGLRLADMLRTDVTHAVRQIRNNPGVALVAVLSMALGIGATTAVYSVVHAVLIDTHPYRGADHMVHFTDLASARTFEAWQELDAFDGVTATDYYHMNLTSGELPEAVGVGRVSANLFDFLGVPPVLGRAFNESGYTAVLTHGFWQRYFGGDPGALGKTLRLDGKVYTVIGVMPPRLRWKTAEVFIPAKLEFYRSPSLEIVARLKPGVPIAQAEAQSLAAMRELFANLPDDYQVRFQPLKDRATRPVRGTLLLFLAAVSVLLLVACANVSILLLARGTARQHELALRAAIGASRRRIAGQLLTESVLLSVAGAGLGALLAVGALEALLRWLPPDRFFPPEADIRLSMPVLVVTLAVTLATGVLAGFAPAIRFSLPKLHELVQAAGQRLTGNRAGRRAQHVLVAAQVALTMLLLAGAGAAVRALVGLYHTELGYDPTGFARLTVPTPEGSYPTWEERKAFAQQLRERVSTLPNVEVAAMGVFSPPFRGSNQPVEIFGAPADPQRRLLTQDVSSQYFAALKMPVRQGRIWSEDETDRAALVGVLNDAAVKRYFPAGAIGQKIRLLNLRAGQWNVTPAWSTDWIEIVGVVGDVPNRGLQEAPAPAVYIPYTLWIGDNLSLVVRARDPRSVVRAVREEIHAVAPGQSIGAGPHEGVRTGEELLRENGWQDEEIASWLFGGFAALALALAAVGLYSTMSYATTLRSQEFGIRVALGARRGDIARTVLRPAAWTVTAGVAAGLATSLASNKLLSAWTTASVFDAWVLGPVVAVLVGVAGIAALAPAARAARVDPARTLRE